MIFEAKSDNQVCTWNLYQFDFCIFDCPMHMAIIGDLYKGTMFQML